MEGATTKTSDDARSFVGDIDERSNDDDDLDLDKLLDDDDFDLSPSEAQNPETPIVVSDEEGPSEDAKEEDLYDLDALLDGNNDEQDPSNDILPPETSVDLPTSVDKEEAIVPTVEEDTTCDAVRANNEDDLDLDALLDDDHEIPTNAVVESDAHDPVEDPIVDHSEEDDLQNSTEATNPTETLLPAVDAGGAPESPVAAEDALALELDALLDDDHHEAEIDIEVTEEEPLAEDKTTNSTQSKVPNARAFFPRTEKPRKQTKLFQNNSSAISASLSESKKKIASTRDRVKEYSRDLSKRASDRMKKETTKQAGRSSFMTTTLNSTKKLGGRIIEEVKEKKSKPRVWGIDENASGLPHFMRSTSAFTQKITETQTMHQNKLEAKRIEARKMAVNLAPWKHRASQMAKTTFSSPIPRPKTRNRLSPIFAGTISSETRVQHTKKMQEQKQKAKEEEAGKCVVDLSPLAKTPDSNGSFGRFGMLSPRFRKTPKAAGRYESPFAGDRSVGSVSSYCTVESFVNPVKAGIVGCQNPYEPLLYQSRGPCELCVFRLSDSEREKLEKRGRHMMVQMTTGGCRNCSAFPRDKDEPPVRLCRKCHGQSHRRISSTSRRR